MATRIAARTGLRARTADQFTADTVRWFFINSEDVGDIASMISIAMLVGFGVTGVMLYMFTEENLKQYAVLKAMGATPRLLLTMILGQAGLCALLGAGIGLGLCAIVGQIAAAEADYPFRMMWFTPLFGGRWWCWSAWWRPPSARGRSSSCSPGSSSPDADGPGAEGFNNDGWAGDVAV